MHRQSIGILGIVLLQVQKVQLFEVGSNLDDWKIGPKNRAFVIQHLGHHKLGDIKHFLRVEGGGQILTT